jgi:transposase
MMDEDTLASLYLDFRNNNAKTQQARANSIYLEKGIKVSQQVISYNIRKDIDFARKKGAKRYSGLKMEKVRQFFKENGRLYSLPNCLAWDEFHTHLGEAPQYAWSRKGCPAEIIQTGQKIATYTVMVCIQNINKQGIISCEVIKNGKKKIKDEKTGKEKIKKGTNALDFYNCFKNINLPTNEKYYLLLDNAPIHSTTDKLRELGLSIEELADQKNVILVYFPKYAPQINPVELCICFIKNYIKSNQPRTEEKLREVIKEAVAFLNQKDLSE